MKVLVSDPIHSDGIEMLRKAGYEVNENFDLSKEQLKSLIRDYDVIIVRSKTKLTKDVIEAGKKLKVIGRAGVGLDNVDKQAAEIQGIKVINTPDVSTTSVAELVMGYIISLARHITRATESLRRGEFEKEKFSGIELAGKTIGIIGTGRIGMAVAKLARCFEMTVIGYDPYVKHSDTINTVELDTLLRNSDVITVHTPMTDDTKHMISNDEIKKMKRGVILVNAARGGILDEEAIRNGLVEGIIGGVALDVFESEKPFRSILTTYDNFIGTPHTGAQTEQAQKRAGIEVARKVLEQLNEIKGEKIGADSPVQGHNL
jgi:D-3-phosphoglycerate dehydrogenase